MNKTNVLFLSTANSARSQMAEVFLRHYAGDKYQAYSAGLEPKGIDAYTIRVMNEIGVEMSGHASKSVREYMGKVHFGYLITVCAYAEEHCPTTFPGVGQRLHWAFDDPVKFEGSDEARLQKFREVRDQIDDKIQAWLKEQTN